jgi:hypothetical protein
MFEPLFIFVVRSMSFFVVADHDEKEIVIAIRGSCSIADVATDLDFALYDLSQEGYEGHFAHKGFARAALKVMNQLEKSSAFQGFLREHSEFQIKIVGHSAGGCTGSVLAMLMKKPCKFL